MGTQAVSVYQQVMEKTKGHSFKSQMLAINLEKKLSPKDKDTVSWCDRYLCVGYDQLVTARPNQPLHILGLWEE